jgi:hypothetical protein
MPKTTFKNGIEVPKFDHTSNDQLDAIGYTTEEAEAVIDKANGILRECTDQNLKYSAAMERLHNEMSKIELIVLIMNENVGRKTRNPLEELLGLH